MKSDDIKPVTPFSWRFAEAFRAITDGAGVTQVQIHKQSGRAQAYVSERLRGIRPIDTDIIDAAATLLGVEPKELVRRVLREMGEAGATVTVLKPKKPSGDAASVAYVRSERTAAGRRKRRVEDEPENTP